MAENSPKVRILALMEEERISGPAKNLLEFHRECRKSGGPVDLSIAAFRRSPRTDDLAGHENPFVQRAKEQEIPVHWVDEAFRFDLRTVPGLRRLVDRTRPDVIETHHVKSNFLVRLSGLWKQTPWIAFHHGYTDTTLFRSPLYNRLDRWSLQVSPRIVTMNGYFKEQLVLHGAPADRITVLHNAVPASEENHSSAAAATRSRLRSDLGIEPEAQIILSIGRLSKEKALADLVPAMHRLRQMRPDRAFRLIIAGEGPEGPNILRAIREAGLDQNIMLVGHINDIRPYYGAADVLAIPSHSEGSPNVLLEAMALGLPVVATAVGGIPEIASHGKSALLVPPSDPDSMAGALDLLLSSPATAASLAEQARRSVEQDFSPKVRAQALIEIYNGLARSFARSRG
jgi:glycosyltransferase involved in cell wall biosynthesis